MRYFLTLPCGDAHKANQALQDRVRETWSARYGLACPLMRGVNVRRVDPALAAQMQGIATPNGMVPRNEVPLAIPVQRQAWVELLGRSQRPPRRIRSLRGRGAARGGSSDSNGASDCASDDEGQDKPGAAEKREVKREVGPRIEATREEVHQEYLSPFIEFVPFLHFWPAMERRACLNLQSIRACENRAQEEELPGLAKLLQGLIASYERTLSVHQERFDLLGRCLFLGKQRSLLKHCSYSLAGPLPGVSYNPELSLAENVQKIANRFPLPLDFLTLTEAEAAAHWNERVRAAGTCVALQAKISPEEPGALVFASMGGRSLFNISVLWGQTRASELQDQALRLARSALNEQCEAVTITKPSGSVLDPQQITPLMSKEFQ
jgi:hypothetical protein